MYKNFQLTAVKDFPQGIEESILGVLAYFDIFQYPITIGEIEQFRQDKGDIQQLHSALDGLLRKEIVFRLGDFYSLQNNPLLEYRRKEGNLRAIKMIAHATRNGRFLQRFPFVRAVGISGSLSKNYADKHADFDFFIITRANRLWIARTFMHLYKKLTLLTGRQHYYCMNYYLDEKALTLDDQNIFSAIELKTLIPVSGENNMQEFFDANQWSGDWLPFCKFKKQEIKDSNRSPLKRAIEWFINIAAGNKIDDILYRITTRRWKRKEELGKKNEKGQVMVLHTSKHFAKSNPGDFQEKVLDLYHQKLRELNCKVIM
jgi:hypothetical protein